MRLERIAPFALLFFAIFDATDDRVKVPLHNENDPCPPPESQSPSVSNPIEQSTKLRDARVRARYDTELPPFISIVLDSCFSLLFSQGTH